MRSTRILTAVLLVALLAVVQTPPILAKDGQTLPPSKACGIQKALDSLKYSPLFKTQSQNSSTPDQVSMPHLVYEIKLADIDRRSPISFDYNPYVQRYIDIYTIERREQVSQMLGLAQLYFPLFDEMLLKYNLPLELKYLAVVESALNPLAVSPSGAVGLWQFLLHTGRMFNLEVNSYVDERRDPILSTRAACRYLDYLYRIFDDWHLVMAAYNAGPGVVKNAITRANGNTDFWEIYPHLPEAPQNYVSAFIAAAYIMQNAADHGIYPTLPIINYEHRDTVHVTNAASFKEISNATNVSIDLLRFLNPSFHKDFIPQPEEYSVLHLSLDAIELFIKNEELIYDTTPGKGKYQRADNEMGSTKNKHRVVHIVKSGEYLHKVAIDYRCTVDDILIWNPNAIGSLSPGDSLTMWVNRNVLNQINEGFIP